MQHWTPMDVAAGRVSRRSLLWGGVGAAGLLLGGGVAWLWRPGLAGGRLTTNGRAVFLAFAAAVLEGCLPTEPGARARSLVDHARHLDETLAALPPPVRGEIGLLLGLLSLAAGRRWLTGLEVDWAEADVPAVQAALERMRASDDVLRLQAYHALRDLNNAAFFAQREHWPLLGYPGPTPV
ncbi:MAG TPA: hypothetical protein VJM48_12155 [Methylibium sp.]|nr:hypothetical protein [Methylibium sp.]